MVRVGSGSGSGQVVSAGPGTMGRERAAYRVGVPWPMWPYHPSRVSESGLCEAGPAEPSQAINPWGEVGGSKTLAGSVDPAQNLLECQGHDQGMFVRLFFMQIVKKSKIHICAIKRQITKHFLLSPFLNW